MVTEASAGPIEKSAALTGGKRDAELGAEVGSANIAEQPIAEVGVSIMIGFSTINAGVGGVSVSFAHPLSMMIPATDKKKRNGIRFIYGFTTSCNCSYFHIHDMVLTKSASDLL